MADNNHGTYRTRGPAADQDADPAFGGSDPLAELARLIGQADPVGEMGRRPRRDPMTAYVEVPVAGGGTEWAHDDYAEGPEADDYADEGVAQPAVPEPYLSARSYAREERVAVQDDRAYQQETYPASYAPPLAFEDERVQTPAHDERYADAPPTLVGRQLSPLAPQSYQDEYQPDDQWREEEVAAQPIAPNDYEDDAPRSVRRGGYAVALAVLGLATLGVAGAFGYRTMFGGSVLPSLPPIIKASDGPNKIIPSHGDTQADATSTGSASGASGEKLVSREEQPLNIQTPPPTPRVVSTIPVLPPSGGAPQGGPPAVAPAAPSPWPAPAPVAASVSPPAPAQPVVAAEPKKIHTVTIRPDQPGSNTDATAAVPPPAPRAAAPRQSVAIMPRAAAPQPSGANAPLAIVPRGGEASPPARTRVARAGPPDAPVATATTPASGGGYAVQVTSQRSEAEAQAAFRSLKAKYPGQLGSREPIIRRADLGDKGTYYRAMVGPFASAEAAAGLCGSLKAAGGTCIVQRN